VTILATAAFIDTALGVVAGTQILSAVLPSVAVLLGIWVWNSLIDALTGLADAKRAIYLRKTISPEILERVAKLEYRHIENQDTADLLNQAVFGGFRESAEIPVAR
jgi:ABC-type transport system involved in cytochrome bd biosynthesis fused ATPase/permease subunit